MTTPKNTVTDDWTARILRLNCHTASGHAALSIQLSSVTAGAVFEFHLSGAASGTTIPATVQNYDVDCSATVFEPFSASDISGSRGNAFVRDDGIGFNVGNKGGKLVLLGSLDASISGADCNLIGTWLLKHATNLKTTASTDSAETFTNSPGQLYINQTETYG